MSETQPRKRKEKRRKKEDSIEAEPVLKSGSTASGKEDDYNIHLHHDAHTGGGWCAKIIFFLLLAVIGVLIGVILMEYRGSTDLDAPVQESKYAEIFQGWVDDTPQLHDDEDDHALDEHSDEVEHDTGEEFSHEIDDDHTDEEHEEEGEHDENDESIEPQEADEIGEDENISEVDDNVSEIIDNISEADDNNSEADQGNDDDEDDGDDNDNDDNNISEENENVIDASNESTNKDDDDEVENSAQENDAEEDDDGDDTLSEEDIQKVLNSLNEGEALEEITESAEDDVIDNNPAEAEMLRREQEENEAEEEETTGGEVKPVPGKSTAEAESTPSKKSTSGAQSIEDELLDDEQYFREHNPYDNNVERTTVEKYRLELQTNSTSTRALYGLAIALDRLAEKMRSNRILQESILAYQSFLTNAVDAPVKLFKKAANRCINRMRFKGDYGQAVTIHQLLLQKFPEDIDNRNQLAVTYLMSDRIRDAKNILQTTLTKWPSNGFAKVHYGFILKTQDNNIALSAEYLQSGINSGEPGVLDGRFFFHLGDALTRLGKNNEAMKVYEKGVEHGFFLSKYQRSLYNVDRLTGRPWWTKDQTTYTNFFNTLEANWKMIRKEGLALLNTNGLFQDESENLRDIGDWKQFELFTRGKKIVKNCQKAPFTCSLIDSFDAASECKRGQTKFSVMHPGTHVWPHCGPTNCRLRAHLGLKVPNSTFIRVAEVTKSWKEGKIFIFDDSFEHEVWHNGTNTRLILIVDVWHPELTAFEKRSLPAI